MSAYFDYSRYMPCPECGASLARGDEGDHVCEPERVLDYRIFQLRGEIGGFDSAFRDYLESPEGRFEQWRAERGREH